MAFFHTPRPHEPFLRAPAVVLWLIAALVAAYVPSFFVSAQTWDYVLSNYGFVPVRYDYAYLAARHWKPGSLFDQAAPFVTYMFLHAGLAHLAVNSLWLLAFGPTVARRFGTVLFLLFFFICGVAAVLVHLVFNWESLGPVIGASGAISGLMAAAMRMLRLPGSYSFRDEVPLTPIFSRQVMTFTVVWTVVNVLAGLGLTGLSDGNTLHLVAWQAHLGGFGAGLLLSGIFDRLARRRSSMTA